MTRALAMRAVVALLLPLRSVLLLLAMWIALARLALGLRGGTCFVAEAQRPSQRLRTGTGP